jgi:hypothetical protein
LKRHGCKFVLFSTRDGPDLSESSIKYLEREAANRKELYDVKASEQKLDPGTVVFLRNHVKGRNKIQDKWNSKYYKIIKCIDSDRYVYLIELSDKSGPSRVENRTNLQPCRFKERYTSPGFYCVL